MSIMKLIKGKYSAVMLLSKIFILFHSLDYIMVSTTYILQLFKKKTKFTTAVPI